MIDEQKYYETIDMPFYREEIEPKIPGTILDFHTHVWHPSHFFKQNPWEDEKAGEKYMVSDKNYTYSMLQKDADKIFPGKEYNAVCFGMPTPMGDPVIINDYVSKGAASRPSLFPLMIAGKGLLSGEEIEKTLIDGGFYGYKVFLNWSGDHYGDVLIDDMLSSVEMKIADKYRLID